MNKKYEYLMKDYYYPIDIDKLNELGEEGWEIITVSDFVEDRNRNGRYMATRVWRVWFKKEKTEFEEE